MPRRGQRTDRAFVDARDRQIRTFTLAGYSAAWIARKFDLTPRTVVRARARLRAKGEL